MLIREIDMISRIELDFGGLGALDFLNLPFVPKRMYWLIDTPADQIRGRHAHKKLSQCIFVLKGSCELEIRNEFETKVFKLNTDEKLFYLKPGLWRELSNFEPGSVVCVLADEIYDENDYIRNFDEYLEWVKNES